MRSGALTGGIMCAVGVAMAAGGPAPGETQAQPPRGLSSQLPQEFGETGPATRPLRDAAAPESRGTTGAEDVPSPGTVALLAVGGAIMSRRKRRFA